MTSSDELVTAISALRGVFASGVTPELVRWAYAPLGRYLGWQPVCGWERVEDGRFAGAATQYAVVGTVPFELPGMLSGYLTRGSGSDPDTWGIAPSVPTSAVEVWLRYHEADPSGLNQVLWTEDLAHRSAHPEVRLPGNMAPGLLAQADQLSAIQAEHGSATDTLVAEALLETPDDSDGFWDLPT